MSEHLLSIITFLPLAGLVLLLFLPGNWPKLIKSGCIVVNGFQLVLAIFIFYLYKFKEANSPLIQKLTGQDGFQFKMVEKSDWIDLSLGELGHVSIDYFLGLDGLSITLLLLACLVLFIGSISSWTIRNNVKGYFALYLLLSTSVVGCFLALDFFLFYLFFEFMLLPMYFLIGMWGGPRKEYAAIKFFLYTLAGSILILIVMIGLYLSVFDPVETGIKAGLIHNEHIVTEQTINKTQEAIKNNTIDPQNIVHTFNMVAMTDRANFIPESILSISGNFFLGNIPIRLLAFLALFIGFLIKLPGVPFHTWLPDAHVEAPTPISVVLAGILLKIGGYGLLRTAYSIFPEGGLYFTWWIGFLGILAIIYGALNAMAMKDIKRLIAYSSISHMGFVLLGFASLTTEGLSGSLYQMFSHGMIASMLFLIAGVFYDRTHDRMIANYSGLASIMPGFTSVVVIAFFAALGLPGFSGFIAELFVFLGAFNAITVNELMPAWMPVIATIGLVLTAAYFLWTLQKMFFGQFFIKEDAWLPQLKDLNFREYAMFLPLIIGIILFGLFPNIFLEAVNTTVNHLTTYINGVGRDNLNQILQQ